MIRYLVKINGMQPCMLVNVGVNQLQVWRFSCSKGGEMRATWINKPKELINLHKSEKRLEYWFESGCFVGNSTKLIAVWCFVSFLRYKLWNTSLKKRWIICISLVRKYVYYEFLCIFMQHFAVGSVTPMLVEITQNEINFPASCVFKPNAR